MIRADALKLPGNGFSPGWGPRAFARAAECGMVDLSGHVPPHRGGRMRNILTAFYGEESGGPAGLRTYL